MDGLVFKRINLGKPAFCPMDEPQQGAESDIQISIISKISLAKACLELGSIDDHHSASTGYTNLYKTVAGGSAWEAMTARAWVSQGQSFWLKDESIGRYCEHSHARPQHTLVLSRFR